MYLNIFYDISEGLGLILRPCLVINWNGTHAQATHIVTLYNTYLYNTYLYNTYLHHLPSTGIVYMHVCMYVWHVSRAVYLGIVVHHFNCLILDFVVWVKIFSPDFSERMENANVSTAIQKNTNKKKNEVVTCKQTCWECNANMAVCRFSSFAFGIGGMYTTKAGEELWNSCQWVSRALMM